MSEVTKPNMAAETISVVIPLYNKQPYIARAITSILAQTRSVDEIIIVDDASTDGSLDQVKAFQDPRIRVFCRADPQARSLPATRNLGIQLAASRWIALLDADDHWHDDFIEECEKLVKCATARVGLVFTGWQSVWPDGTLTRDPYSASRPDESFQALDLDAFVSAWLDSGACPVFPSGVVIRREALLAAGMFNVRCRRGEDKEMWVRLLAITDALGSPRVCSSYYCAIPGAMNDNITTNVRHCLCATLDQMIAQAVGLRRHLLKRLFNHSVLEYAHWVSGRERLSPDVYRGFFVSANPQHYILLLVLTYVPTPVLQFIRGVFFGSRRRLKRM